MMTETVGYSASKIRVVCLTSKRGKPKAVWLMTDADAKTFCSDERTSGGSWMFFFEALERWVDASGTIPKKHTREDDGQSDEILTELGITPRPLSESRNYLHQVRTL